MNQRRQQQVDASASMPAAALMGLLPLTSVQHLQARFCRCALAHYASFLHKVAQTVFKVWDPATLSTNTSNAAGHRLSAAMLCRKLGSCAAASWEKRKSRSQLSACLGLSRTP